MTRRSSGFSTEGKCFIVLIRGKARIRHAGLFTRVMLSSFSHPSQVMTSTLMSIVPGLARFSHTGSDFRAAAAGRITEGLKERGL